MNYFLIDYENVGPDGISDLNEACTGDCVIIFFSECCKNISLELIESLTSRGVKILSQKVKTGSKKTGAVYRKLMPLLLEKKKA